MYKKFPWFTVVATLVAWMLFWEVKETISGERMLFICRWIYSDLSYAKNIQVKTYLLTDQQVSYMFAHPDDNVQQSSKLDPSLENLNLVIRLTDTKAGGVSGKLRWKIQGSDWNIVNVAEIPRFTEHCNIVIPVGEYFIKNKYKFTDSIEVKWEEIYVFC